MDAKEFLKQNGVAVLTEVIVEENKVCWNRFINILLW